MSLGGRLRAIRVALNLNQEAMARRVGLAGGSWKRLELEDRAPKGDVLTLLADIGFSTDWLLTGEGQMLRYPDGAKPPEGSAPGTGKVAGIIDRLMEEKLKPGPELEQTLRAIVADPAAAKIDLDQANLLLGMIFRDQGALKKREADIEEIGRRVKAADHVLNTALKAVEWTPSPLIWHTLQSHVFSYGVELDDLVNLLGVLKREIDR